MRLFFIIFLGLIFFFWMSIIDFGMVTMKIFRWVLVWGLVWGLGFCKKNDGSGDTDTSSTAITCIDVHSQPAYPELGDGVDLEGILTSMAANHVSKSILSARGDVKYTYDIASFAEANPEKIVAAVALKLTQMETDEGFYKYLGEQVNSGRFTAIAEILLYHAQKFDTDGNSTAPEKMVRPSDAKVTALINAANQLKCPLFLHIEFQSLEKAYGSSMRTTYMNELKQLFTTYPNQKFVLIHVAELSPAECRELLDAYSNVYFTTNFMDLTILMTGDPDPNYSESEWNALFKDHSIRFVFAFDRVFASQWSAYARDMNYAQKEFAKLASDVANAIGSSNAQSLWNF